MSAMDAALDAAIENVDRAERVLVLARARLDALEGCCANCHAKEHDKAVDALLDARHAFLHALIEEDEAWEAHERASAKLVPVPPGKA